MELTSDIGRGHDDDERPFVAAYLRGEIASLQPELVDSVLNLLGLIGFWEFTFLLY
jgi:hypothetical protein